MNRHLRTVLTRSFSALLVVLVCGKAEAQQVPEPTISWDVSFWSNGVDPNTGSPITTQNFLKSGSLCNQAPVPPPTGTVIITTSGRLVLDDPDNPGRACILGPNSNGTLTSLPAQVGIFGTAKARGATTVSLQSAVSNPFNHAVATIAATPTNLRVVP